MHRLRRARLLTVIFSLWALLFAQGAMAGYACPLSEKAAQVAGMFERQLPCAGDMAQIGDDLQPGLCHAHCQSSQQSTDTARMPALPSLLQLGAVLTVAAVPELHPLATAPQRAPQRTGDPPIAIAHCCFRI